MIFLWIYLLGYALSLRPLFRWHMNDIRCSYPNWEDICLSIIMAFLTGASWPLLFVGICLKRTIGSCNPETFIRRVGGESREQKMKRKRKELRSHQETVERLENELNIEC